MSILDDYSLNRVHREIHERMTERDVETILQLARERFPAPRPRVISDNGPQFIAGEFQQFIRLCGMTQARTSSYYPRSNGKIEQWHKSIREECTHVKTPLSLEDTRRAVAAYIAYCSMVRLHSAIGYLTPADNLAVRRESI